MFTIWITSGCNKFDRCRKKEESKGAVDSGYIRYICVTHDCFFQNIGHNWLEQFSCEKNAVSNSSTDSCLLLLNVAKPSANAKHLKIILVLI